MYGKWMIFIGLVLIFVPALLARRNNKFEYGTQKEKQNCSSWTYGPCVLKNEAATCGVGKKLATSTDENCPKKEKQLHCRIPCTSSEPSDCHYKMPNKLNNRKLHCDPMTNKQTVILKLVKGDSSCSPTKVVYKECRSRQVRAAGAKGNRKTGEHKQKQAAGTTATSIIAQKSNADCKYLKAKRSKVACDPVTNTRILTRQLKKNSPATCEPTKTVTETCRPAKPKQGSRKNSGRKAQEK